jgi:hypothetical protein
LRDVFNEYRINITLFELQIRNLAAENGNVTLTQITTGEVFNFLMAPDTLRSFILGTATYTLNWTNYENDAITNWTISLTTDRVINLPTVYFDVFFSMYNYDFMGLNNDMFRFYINGERRSFGFNTLIQDVNTLQILDFFNSTLFSRSVNLTGLTEYSMMVAVYTLFIKNAFENDSIQVKMERDGFSEYFLFNIPAQGMIIVNILPGIEYKCTAYYSGDIINERNKFDVENVECNDLDDNFQTVEFGFYTGIIQIDPYPLVGDLASFLFIAIGIIVIIGALYLNLKTKETVSNKSIIINKPQRNNKKARSQPKKKGWNNQVLGET